MADERYNRFLGIESGEDVPTYYELLGISPEELDGDSLEKAYKTQIRKLQQIRTSKDTGFIEFLKEEMRTAKRILSKPDKRKEYDESLLEGALAGFKGFVGSLMVMGHINKTLYDTMVQRGVADGLSETQAVSAIQALAKEHGATLETEETAPAPAATAPEEDYGGYDDGYDYADADAGADYGDYDYGDQSDSSGYADYQQVEEPAYAEEATPRRAETVLQAPPQRQPPPPIQQHPSSYDDSEPEFADEEASPQGPWYRGIGEEPPPWGRRAGSRYQLQRRTSKPGATRAPRSKELEAAVRFYNLGAALAKVASDVHEKLKLYYPPGKPPNKMINGVPAQKVLDTEQSTYRECLKKFQSAMDRVGSTDGDGDLVRVRSTQSVSLVQGILEEIKQHKLRLMGGLPQQEETRAWQEFVGKTRPPRLTRVID